MRWAALAAALLAGCGTVGPDYERPDLALPAAFPASATDAASTAAEVSASWWTLYRSAELDRLVAQALARNSDIAQAVARVEQADAALRQTGAAVLPEVNADASAGRQRLSSLAVPPQGLTGNAIRLGLSASYEIDFWGRVRRLNEAARAGLLASRYARDTVRLTIASLTTQAWFALHSLDDQIRLTEGTLRTREEGTRLLRLRLDHGSGSALDVEQSEGLRAASAVLLRDLQRQRALAGSQLALLAGQFDLALAEGSLRDLPLPPAAPPGLPSALLERRPDVMSAEQRLVSANAQIGVARAEIFPRFALTGALGGESEVLSGLLKTPGRFWSFGLDIAAPIFDGGRRAAATDQAIAQQHQALGAYRGSVEAAFKEVADALANVQAAVASRADLESADRSAAHALALARLRYDSGYSPYLDLLEAQRSASAAKLDLVRNRQAQLAASVDLFRALGGGWRAEDSVEVAR